MNKKMHSRSVTVAELRAGTIPHWVTKNGDIITTEQGLSAYVLATGEAAGVLTVTLSDDTRAIDLPIIVSDILTMLPDIRTIDLSTTTVSDNIILFGEPYGGK
jgi:hypothetical protein